MGGLLNDVIVNRGEAKVRDLTTDVSVTAVNEIVTNVWSGALKLHR